MSGPNHCRLNKNQVRLKKTIFSLSKTKSTPKRLPLGTMERVEEETKPDNSSLFNVDNLEGNYAQFAASLEEKDARDFKEMYVFSPRTTNTPLASTSALENPGSSVKGKANRKVLEMEASDDSLNPQTDSDSPGSPEHTSPSGRSKDSTEKRTTGQIDSPSAARERGNLADSLCSQETDKQRNNRPLMGQPRKRSMYHHLLDVNIEGMDMRFLDIDDGHLRRLRMGGDNLEIELQVLMINAISNQFLNVRRLPGNFDEADIEWFLPEDVTPLDRLLATQGALIAIKLRDNHGVIWTMKKFEELTKGMAIGSLRVGSTCQRLLENNIRVMTTCTELSEKAQNCVKSLTEGMRKLAESTERSYASMQGMSREISNLRVENKESGKQQAKIMPGHPAPPSNHLSIGASSTVVDGVPKPPAESGSDILKRMDRK